MPTPCGFRAAALWRGLQPSPSQCSLRTPVPGWKSALSRSPLSLSHSQAAAEGAGSVRSEQTAANRQAEAPWSRDPHQAEKPPLGGWTEFPG